MINIITLESGIISLSIWFDFIWWVDYLWNLYLLKITVVERGALDADFLFLFENNHAFNAFSIIDYTPFVLLR